ncbi:YlbL family protein [Gordonia sp. NPDC003422]
MTLQAQYRRIATVAVTTLVLVVLLVLGTQVLVPYVALGPGPTLNTLGTAQVKGQDGKVQTLPIVDIQGAQLDPTTGNLNLTTVSVTDGLSLFEAMGKWLSGEYALQPRDRIYDPDKTTDQVREENAQQMTGSEDDATAAALRFLNRPTKLVIGTIVSSGPSSTVLKLGDQVNRVGGTPVVTAEDFDNAVEKAPVGKPLTLDIVRNNVPSAVSVIPRSDAREPGKANIGADGAVVNADPGLKITYSVGDIGGPSAGMMLSLAVIDKLSPGELTHGKFIAGTGTITDTGVVGPIGGITHKTRAARDAGATVFLVPGSNCSEAASDKPDGLELVKVDSLQGAVDSLNALGAGRPVTHC